MHDYTTSIGIYFDVLEKDRANSENFQNVYCFVANFFNMMYKYKNHGRSIFVEK